MSQGLPFYSSEWIWFHTPQVSCPTNLQPENITRVFLISRHCCGSVRASPGLAVACRWAISISDEEVSGWLGPCGARWSIIYYRTSLLLPCVFMTNALRRDSVPEVNAARLTPRPPLTNTVVAWFWTARRQSDQTTWSGPRVLRHQCESTEVQEYLLKKTPQLWVAGSLFVSALRVQFMTKNENVMGVGQSL